MVLNLVSDDPQHGEFACRERGRELRRQGPGGRQAPASLERPGAISCRPSDQKHELPGVCSSWSGRLRRSRGGLFGLLSDHHDLRDSEPRGWSPEGSAPFLDGFAELLGLTLGQASGGELLPGGARKSIERLERRAADGLKLFCEHVEPLGLGPRRASRSRSENARFPLTCAASHASVAVLRGLRSPMRSRPRELALPGPLAFQDPIAAWLTSIPDRKSGRYSHSATPEEGCQL